MQKKRFKPSGTARGFKGVGSGLQIGERRLTEQRQREIDAIALSKEQAKEASNIHIAGLTDATKFEEGILTVKQKLEANARQTRYDAIKKHAETDVKRLEGEAKELKKTSDAYAKLAPKFAQNLGKLASGSLMFADRLAGEAQWKELNAKGFLNEWRDNTVNNNYNIAQKGTEGTIELSKEDPAAANELQKQTVILSSYWAQQKLLAWVKDNKESIRNDIIANFQKARGNNIISPDGTDTGLKDNSGVYSYQEHNAIDVMDAGARALLRRFGIKEGSATGVDIINEVTNWGAVDTDSFYKTRKVTETQTRLEDLTSLWVAARKNNAPLEHQNLLFNNIVLAYHNGYFKGKTNRINDPTKGERFNLGDSSIEAAKLIVERNLENLDTDADVRTLFEGYLIPGGKELFIVKHERRFEDEVIEHFVTIKNKDEEDKTKLQKANGVVLVNSIREKANAARASETGITLQNRIEWTKEILASRTTEGMKKKALEEFNFNKSDYKDLGLWNNFMIAVNAGDEKEWMKIYGDLPASLKKRAEQKIELIKIIHESTSAVTNKQGTTLTGMEAFIYNNRSFFESKDKGTNKAGKVLDRTGERALDFYNQTIIDELTKIQHLPMSSAEKMALARKNTDDLFNDRVQVNADGFPVSGDGKSWKGYTVIQQTNPFNYRLPSDGKAGEYTPSTVYINFEDGDANKNVAQTAILKKNSWEDINTAVEESNDNTGPIPFKDGTLVTGIENGYISIDEAIRSPRFMSPKDWVDLNTYIGNLNAKKFRDGDPYFNTNNAIVNGKPGFEIGTVKVGSSTYTGPISVSSYDITEQSWWPRLVEIRIASGSGSGSLTEIEILNKEILRRGGEVLLTPNGLDASKIQNNGKPVKPRDAFGVTQFNAFKAQGHLPKTKNVQLFTQGLDVDQIFSETTGVTWEVTDKGITFSNPKGAIENDLVSVKYPITWKQLQSLNLVDRDANEEDLPENRTTETGWVNPYTYDPSTDQDVIKHIAEINKRKAAARKKFFDNIGRVLAGTAGFNTGNGFGMRSF